MVLLIICWCICGIFNWCAVLGELSEYGESRDHYGMALLMAILGPVVTVALAVTTNLFRYGFKLK